MEQGLVIGENWLVIHFLFLKFSEPWNSVSSLILNYRENWGTRAKVIISLIKMIHKNNHMANPEGQRWPFPFGFKLLLKICKIFFLNTNFDDFFRWLIQLSTSIIRRFQQSTRFQLPNGDKGEVEKRNNFFICLGLILSEVRTLSIRWQDNQIIVIFSILQYNQEIIYSSAFSK